VTPLKIGHGNGHNKSELVTFARSFLRAGGDSFGANESQRLTPALAELGRITVADGRPADRVRSTAIVTSRDLLQLGETSLRVADAMPDVNEKLHPDRNMAASFYAHAVAGAIGAAGVAHFNVHPPATVMKHDSRHHPVVVAYGRALEVVREQMRAARAAGYLLVLTGDLQAGARYQAPWGPRELIAKPLRLSCRVVRIDWLMFDAELQLRGQLQQRELYDHTGFTAELIPS
jgi:hypothetical protein